MSDAERLTGVTSVSSGGGTPPGAPERWQLHVAGLLLTIERLSEGRWVALYGGFSRVAGWQLAEAIAVAVGADGHEPWIAELAEAVEVDSSRNGAPKVTTR